MVIGNQHGASIYTTEIGKGYAPATLPSAGRPPALSLKVVITLQDALLDLIHRLGLYVTKSQLCLFPNLSVLAILFIVIT